VNAMGLNSSDIFDSYKIKTLIDNLGRIQREIIDKGCHIAYRRTKRFSLC